MGRGERISYRQRELSPGLIAALKSYPLPKEGDFLMDDTARKTMSGKVLNSKFPPESYQKH